jgi:hypothetical protein
MNVAKLPPKKTFGAKSPEFLNKRRQELQDYMRQVHCSVCRAQSLRVALCVIAVAAVAVVASAVIAPLLLVMMAVVVSSVGGVCRPPGRY